MATIKKIYKNGVGYEFSSGRTLNGYIGFSQEGDPSEISSEDLTEVTGAESYSLTNSTDSYFLWVMSASHITVECGGVKLPLYYTGTKNGLHVYRSDAMEAGSFFVTFGIGDPNEPIDAVPILYTLTYSMLHITASGPQTIMGTDQATIFLTADTGYSLPSEVTVTNATVVSYDDENGNLVISGATGNVTVTAAGVVEVYSITNILSSVTNSNDATTATYGSAYNATLTPASGYEITALSVTMGGSPVSVSDNTIAIASVTGDIVITAVAETAGKVTVSVTSGGVAVSGALVTITIDSEEYTGTTNGNGTVLIVSAVGNGTIKVEKEGYVTYTSTIAVGTGSQSTSISISEIPTYTISGECNVDGVTLTIGTHAVEVLNGEYSLSGVQAGTYNISCAGYSASPSSVTVVDDDVDLDISLVELASLSGTIMTEIGDVMPSATVLLQVGGTSYTTTSSSTGAYSFAEVPQGAATLSVTTSAGTVSESITLISGANTKNMETWVALPTGFTRYDVVHATGTGYFSFSASKPTQDTKIVVYGRTDGENSDQHISQTRDNGGPAFGIRLLTSTVKGFFGTQESSEIQNDSTTNKVYELSKDGLVVDGVTVATFNSETFSLSNGLVIANGRGASGTINTGGMRFKGYIYWLKVYESGVLTHYLVPCKNASDADRMYDLKAKQEIIRGGTIVVENENE